MLETPNGQAVHQEPDNKSLEQEFISALRQLPPHLLPVLAAILETPKAIEIIEDLTKNQAHDLRETKKAVCVATDG
jgi:hypothetical protein